MLEKLAHLVHTTKLTYDDVVAVDDFIDVGNIGQVLGWSLPMNIYEQFQSI